METTTFGTRDIQVTSVYFRNNPAEVRFESYPRRLVYKGREYSLLES